MRTTPSDSEQARGRAGCYPDADPYDVSDQRVETGLAHAIAATQLLTDDRRM
jgi:hypothetical protein